MYVARYLLDIEEFMDAENGEALLARAFLRVDEERGEKARRMRPGRARAASLGAGLLLQIGVREAVAGDTPARAATSRRVDFSGFDMSGPPFTLNVAKKRKKVKGILNRRETVSQ